MGFSFGESSERRLKTCSQDIQAIVEAALATSLIDFGIPPYGGKRTEQEQAKLFNQGKSKCDGVNNKSYHQSGKAVDIVAYVDGKIYLRHKILLHASPSYNGYS